MNLLDILQVFPKTVFTTMQSVPGGTEVYIAASEGTNTIVFLQLDESSEVLSALVIDDINRRQYSLRMYVGVSVVYECIELEVEEDFLEKASAILRGEPYDTRVTIPIDIPQEDLALLEQEAVKLNISIDELVEQLLIDAIERENEKISNSKADHSN